MRKDLPLLSIEAASELSKIRLGKEKELKKVSELCNLIKDEFSEKEDYKIIFVQAYLKTYNIESTYNPKEDMKNIIKNLDNPYNLKGDELSDLIYFCTNLSDYSELYNLEIERIKRSSTIF